MQSMKMINVNYDIEPVENMDIVSCPVIKLQSLTVSHAVFAQGDFSWVWMIERES